MNPTPVKVHARFIEDHIGKGGMGMVYRAHDSLVDEVVALKFMNPKLLRTEHGRRLFIQEAQIARRLRHEYIVAVHDVNWTNDGILYLSMELLQGQSLRKHLRQRREERRLLEVRLAVTIVHKVLLALEYAHRTVIHRDLKPENIMLLPGEHVKVLDFGLAKAVEELRESEQSPEKPKKREVTGTFAYASPEQQRRRTVDQRADIFAMGRVLHELLTLRTPLDPPVTVEAVRQDVAPSLLRVLEKALAPEMDARWQSAREFDGALMEAFSNAYVNIPSVETTSGHRGSTEEMVFLEGGSFLMGNNGVPEEAPEAEVHVSPFWMDRHPVTVRQYREYLEATDTVEPKSLRDSRYNGPDQPVIGVTWQEAQAYAAWAGKQLPTEAQWEFAARGKENRKYPWGSIPPDTVRCNFGEHLSMPSNVSMHEDGKTPEGVLDMAGNVWEWTRDPYIPYSRLRAVEGNPPDAPRRSVRGGCYRSPAKQLTTTSRAGLFPESRSSTVGFRCVLAAE